MTDQLQPYSLQNLPSAERPRERLLRHGPEALSAPELLAIILGSGTKSAPVLQLSEMMIRHFGGLQQMSEATVQELCQIKGIGETKAIQLRAAFNLGMRLARNEMGQKFKIEHPIHAYNLIKDELQGEKREIFMIIMQDAKGCVLGFHTVAIGTLTQALVHPREVFYPAIRHKAFSIILVHNHPSGDLTPSKEDITLTQQLIEAGHLMGIPVNDHLIINEHAFLSLRQKGGIFKP